MDHESLDHGLWTFEVGGAAGREVSVIFFAADRRYNDVQAGDIDQLNALAQHDEVRPCALDDHRVHVAQGRQIWRRLSAHGDSGRDESGLRKVYAVITSERYVACQHILKHRCDLAVAVGPVGTDEDSGHRQQSASRNDNDMDPYWSLVPDAAHFTPDTALLIREAFLPGGGGDIEG